ncbi:uncharacterized protein LOC128246094 [Mya arenaria]|uniref:uncharacterized protein LOC128246094 n=1 Tax=Mya arenaria TaxID=6604 RepID=UPI0022E5645A|nr:uncharacterized protein LOC128246094 [Mya arenaria]
MASYRELLKEKEAQNWVKAAFALNITKDGLQDFLEDVLTCVHQDIYSAVRTSKGLPSGAACAHCFTENVLMCPTRGICTSTRNCRFHNCPPKRYAPCPNGICEGVRDEIIKHHRFSGPSWKNTNADKWSTIPWEIGKCFLPPDGYKTVSSIKDSDFNGMISVMINCEDFKTKLSFNVATQQNLLTEVRDIGRSVRHSHDQRVKDTELVDFLFKLRTLLEDKTELANRPEAQHAVEQLKKLQTDDFKISAENEGEIVKEGLRLRLANHYRTTLADMPISPILGEKNAKLRKFYVAPKIVEKDHRKIGKIENQESGQEIASKIENQESGQEIAKFSDVFIKEDQLLRNVFLVGEPGNGKSTFSVMCALDWTHQYLPAEENVGIKTSFADPEFFKEFAFLFHVTLRDSCKTCDLAEMIKDQLIRKIYHEKDADDGYRLLQTVLESETCLIIADGLDEWTHPENVNCTCKTEEKVTPFRNSANKATLLTTTRPWRMSQFRVQDSKIDKYLEIEGAADTEQLVENIINILNGGNEDERNNRGFHEMVVQRFVCCIQQQNSQRFVKQGAVERLELRQDLILSGNREARANNHGDIPLYLAHFYIDRYEDVVVLKKLMMINKERIQSLDIGEYNDQINGEELQEVITSYSDSLKAVTLGERDGQYDLSQCHRLEYLHIEGDNTTPSITDITLRWGTMTAEAVRSLIETMKNIPHTIRCDMYRCTVKPASEMKDIREHMNSSPSFEVLDNALLHTAATTQHEISVLALEVFPYPPYSPDLAPFDFAIFPEFKSHLKVLRFKS